MAVDARLGRRNPRRGRHFDGRVAVAAVNADATGVMLVRELNRLLAEAIGGGYEVRTLQEHHQPAQPHEQEEHGDQTSLGPGIGAFRKNLRHCGSAHTPEGQTGELYPVSSQPATL
jgi:hypothetical protein